MSSTLRTIRQWSSWKKALFYFTVLTFLTSSFLFLTSPGGKIRQWLAETVITTQHRSWAWIFVGAEQRDLMVKRLQDFNEEAAREKQDSSLIKIRNRQAKARSIDELIKVEDISGKFWQGKKMYVFDPKTIRVMTPPKSGEGERITAMVKRTGAVAGVNGGGFDDPEGLGNGFAAFGAIISGGEVIYTDQDGSIAQHIVGFTKEGILVVGKYNIFELRDMGISEAVSFHPRLIANGKPLITSGDGGWGRGPRTAVGQKADGTVIFIVIDGRQAHSVGATLKEVQDLLLEEGCINAGNLDGGASSELVVDGELLTKPSSRYGERRLPNAFLVYDDPTSVKADRVWDGIDKIDAGGSYDHPDFLREQAEKRAKQQQNPTPPAKTDTDKTKTKTDTKPESNKPAANKPETNETGKTGTGKGESAKSGGNAAKDPGTEKPPASGTGSNGTGTADPGKPSGGQGNTPPPTGTGSGSVTPNGGTSGQSGTGSGSTGSGSTQGSGAAGGSGNGSTGTVPNSPAGTSAPGTGSGAPAKTTDKSADTTAPAPTQTPTTQQNQTQTPSQSAAGTTAPPAKTP
ncbi:phosphodiester glycosidase family protein [Paenibacillus ehimensis]|uniref:phosphodiester glycosidase family protein n=1 Tax=Paenibacillus ehimensis TaxID=79264 RepID=UPI001FE45CC7|nr:phosphodiester glycosidase family protein [Paenibacillus ehimensis]MEC0211197.1 phosphodiester glycosidase family protein [Paenibacillus ehimensis]